MRLNSPYAALLAALLLATLPAGVYSQSPNSQLIETRSARPETTSRTAAIISTYAGSSFQGYGGDGGPAISASLNGPSAVALDSAGNLYIADTGNNVVRKVTKSTGVISTVAGFHPGNSGYSGDGGPATEAQLFAPQGVAVDSAGNLYIADTLNFVIRKVAVGTGIITTVVGGAATDIQLQSPTGLAFYAGNLYIADFSDGAIREYNPSTKAVTTVAGELDGNSGCPDQTDDSGDGCLATLAALGDVVDVAFDATGNMYLAQNANGGEIRVVNAKTGIITLFAGTGGGCSQQVDVAGDNCPPTDAFFNPNIGGVAVDSAGDVYGSDSGDNIVRVVDASTNLIQVAAGTYNLPGAYAGDGGPAVGARINDPNGIRFDSAGNLFIADTSNEAIRQVSYATTTTIGCGTTLTSTPDPQISGDNVTFTVTVRPVSGSYVPTGSVALSLNGIALKTITLSSGTGSFTTDQLPVGSDAIGAAYSGDTTCAASTAALTQTITAPVAATPGFAPAAGTYTSTQSVTISDSTTGATIYYTTNGTTPTTSSTKYTGAISVPATETIKAIAVAAGYTNSTVASAAYTIQLFPAGALQFIPVTPCRIADTRGATGAFGGPELAGNATRTFNIPQSACGIPSTAVAYSLNATVVPVGALDYLTVWPAGEAEPTASTLNSDDGRVKANATITPAGTNGGVNVFATDATQFILDIDGYFVPAGTSTAGLEFFPLTPCRIADTRNPDGALGGPALAAGASRAFSVLSSSCDIPATAKAYSLNVTAIPHGPLGYLTAWPTGENQPVASTLNASTGAVTANAAIVPAGTGGDVSIYVFDAADVILDVNGYFAPPAAGGLSLYTVTPCRALDTRNTSQAFDGTLTVPIHTSICMPPATAQAYVLNATVVPPASLGYLTLWPAGAALPNVSTLNAYDGAVTSNMAIVPTTNGSIDAFTSDSTQLILDLSSYFAP